MKVFIPVFFFLCFGAFAQTKPPAPTPPPVPDIPDETVIAIFDDGTPFTMREFKLILAEQPRDNQPGIMANRKSFVEWWARTRKMAQMGEKQKLDQQDPTKEQIAYYRAMLLGGAMLNAQLNSFMPSEEEVAKFYEANKERFKQVRVKVIYIAFGQTTAAGKKSLTEDQAKQKAVSLLGQIRSGADFVKLVKENSDNEASRAKDGDFGTLGANDSLSDAIKKAVFALKPGEVSEPVRQPGGFYLLRADEISYKPLQEAHNEIWTELRQQMYGKWMGDFNENTKVTFPVPAFVGTAPAAPLGAPAK